MSLSCCAGWLGLDVYVVQGDMVAVELHPQSKWAAPKRASEGLSWFIRCEMNATCYLFTVDISPLKTNYFSTRRQFPFFFFFSIFFLSASVA